LNGFNNKKVVITSCGYCYSIALIESGRVFSWGCNTDGELDLNNYKETYLPSIVELSNDTPIKKICCKNSYSLLQSSDDDL
jgi:alpha-tubulin suppressor-like RCC1 family protein